MLMYNDHILKNCNGSTLSRIWFWLGQVNLKSSYGLLIKFNYLPCIKIDGEKQAFFWETWGLIQ